MKLYRLSDYKGGWVVGDFEPTLFASKGLEVCVKHHKQGEYWDRHFHTSTEINVVVSGEMEFVLADGTKSRVFVAGDIVVVEPYEVVKPIFLTDCVVVVIKHPSIPLDKHIVN